MVIRGDYMNLFESGHKACAGCSSALLIRHVLDVLGENTIVCQATGCMEVVSTQYPQSSWRVPYIHVTFENAAAVASGVARAMKIKREDVNVLTLGGDGGMMDIGFQALSGAFERKEDIIVVINDNEAYMNTGIQRSSGTFYDAWTTTSPGGKKTLKKDMVKIALSHGVRYVATATPAHVFDLRMKIKKAKEKYREEPRYIHSLCSCVPGWKINSIDSLKVLRLAVDTCVFPLVEIEDGQWKLTYKPVEKKPVEEYLKLQGRFKHLTKDDIKEIQEIVDKNWEEILKLCGEI